MNPKKVCTVSCHWSTCTSSKLWTALCSDWGGHTALPNGNAFGTDPQSCSPGRGGNAWPTVSVCSPDTGSQMCPWAPRGKGGGTPHQLLVCSQNSERHEGNADLNSDPTSAQWPGETEESSQKRIYAKDYVEHFFYCKHNIIKSKPIPEEYICICLWCYALHCIEGFPAHLEGLWMWP